MYKLNYNKATKKMFDICLEERKGFSSIEITSEEKNEILKGLNNGYKCFINDDETFSLLKEFNETTRLEELKDFRDELLKEQTFYHTDWYRQKLLLIDGIEVDMDVLMTYYLRLHSIETAYGICEEKENFQIIMVDEYSEDYEDDTVNFEIFKPLFIKE